MKGSSHLNVVVESNITPSLSSRAISMKLNLGRDTEPGLSANGINVVKA